MTGPNVVNRPFWWSADLLHHWVWNLLVENGRITSSQRDCEVGKQSWNGNTRRRWSECCHPTISMVIWLMNWSTDRNVKWPKHKSYDLQNGSLTKIGMLSSDHFDGHMTHELVNWQKVKWPDHRSYDHQNGSLTKIGMLSSDHFDGHLTHELVNWQSQMTKT